MVYLNFNSEYKKIKKHANKSNALKNWKKGRLMKKKLMKKEILNEKKKTKELNEAN